MTIMTATTLMAIAKTVKFILLCNCDLPLSVEDQLSYSALSTFFKELFRLISLGLGCCNVVQNGARWCKMVQDGESWCKLVQDGAT